MPVIKFGNIEIIAEYTELLPVGEGFIITGKNVSLQTPEPPCSYYNHGWQSWSLAAWTNPLPLPRPKPTILNPLQIDPVYAQHPCSNGSWLGAVEFSGGNILFLGALNLDSHVQLRNGSLQGWYDVDLEDDTIQKWFIGFGSELEVFKSYAQQLIKVFGHGRAKETLRVWCSWYSLYTAIDENILKTIFKELNDLPFDVLQVDDGWQKAIGDWQANEKFPSGMQTLADDIKSTGRKAGLWLAPLLIVPSSETCKNHPDWLLRDNDGLPVSAGFNWGEQLYTLDTTHPEVLTWLAALMRQVRTWGFDYINLDFLYGGALPGKRYLDIPRESAYRHGLGVIREALGDDAYFLVCGAPILPSLGLCDAMRIGPDVAAEWESYRDAVLLYNPATPSTKNAIRTTINRLWLAPILHTDPDVVYFRPQKNRLNAQQNQLLQDLALVCNFKATSDLPQWLSSSEKESLRNFLNKKPKVEQTGRYTFKIDERVVDFSNAIPLPPKPSGITWLIGAIVGWLGNQPFALKILDTLSKNNLTKIKEALRVK